MADPTLEAAMARKIRHCEQCGDDIGCEVEPWPGHVVVCGKRECQRYERECHAEQRQQAHEQLDRDMGWN